MRVAAPLGISILLGAPAFAAEVKLDVDIPRLGVAEYHRPYVAVWIEAPDRSIAANLAVWYDVNNRKTEGEKWLKDLRQWWRRIGRELEMPVDGISGATRPPGNHPVDFGVHSALNELQPGEYRLVVEAAREVGGREVVEIPFDWPPRQGAVLKAEGKDELGTVTLELKP